MNNTNGNSPTPKFGVGIVVLSSGVNHTLNSTEEGTRFVLASLARHSSGDWGDLDPEDVLSNVEAASDEAIAGGLRVFSVYNVPEELRSEDHPNDRIWIITSLQGWDAETVIVSTWIGWPSEY